MVQSFYSWFEKYSYPLTVFTVSRLSLFLLAYLSLVLIPVQAGPWRAYPSNLFLDGWLRWDAGWYFDIAQRGYTNVPQDEIYQQRDTAFFPLYPLLVRFVDIPVQDLFISGILVSNLAFLIDVILLFKMIRDRFELEVAQRAIILLAFNPFSFFFSAMYSEALFLLAVISAFYWGERQQWPWAALSAALAGATRVLGFLTVIGLVVLYLEQIEFNWRRVRLDSLWILLGLAGPGSYMIFLALKFGNPWQFQESQYATGWGEGVDLSLALETIQSSLSTQALVTGDFSAMPLIHLLSFIVGLLALLLATRRLPLAYLIWAMLTILASLSLWRSMGRFLIVIFPLYIALALLLTGKKFEVVVIGSVLLLGLFTIMFTHWYWVA